MPLPGGKEITMAMMNIFFVAQIVLGCIIGLPVGAVIGLKMTGFDTTVQRRVAAVLAVMMAVVTYGCYHQVPDFWHATLLLVKVTAVLALAFGSLLGLYVGILAEYQYRRQKRREKTSKSSK